MTIAHSNFLLGLAKWKNPAVLSYWDGSAVGGGLLVVDLSGVVDSVVVGAAEVVGGGVARVVRTTDGGSVSTVASGAVALPSTSDPHPERTRADAAATAAPYARSRFIVPA